ncbi:MAG: geranylgeranylglycerol-phosphate geranylgeranyltransferase [Crocinitomicaceae bacterium]|nr:geranylgeranylglycerol-phosphate geranylgeranyltransferase [Crocinitomicaceae bacterium]
MHFIRLIRPLNLIIVALTIYSLGWYFESIYGPHPKFNIYSTPFLLLTISTVMIAAAGNIINDYFDLRADRINKPNKLIIGKHIKRRWAILSHWIINFIAFCIALHLSWEMDTFAYLFIHFASINLLWFYSVYLKRKFFIGNFLIAALTAAVPLLVGLYFHQVYDLMEPSTTAITYFPFNQYSGDHFILWVSFGLAAFAFVLNLAREIVKDMEDVEGDILLKSKSLPITIGYQKSKWIAAIILSGTIVGCLVVWYFFEHIELITMIPIVLSALLVVVCYFLLIKAETKRQYRTINHLIKLSMVAGLISPVYWALLLIYG